MTTVAPTKVSDHIADFLAEKGIRHAFGIIGSGNANIWDAIHRKGFTEIVCVHHEQAAVMAMGTYYRTTGRLACSLLTTGAGSTNGVTGVVSTWMDSIPGLIISGNENSKFTTPDNPVRIWGIQGYDSTAMVEKVTKLAHRVMDASTIRAELERAYEVALAGRPGPVWIDVPNNIQAVPIEAKALKTYTPARATQSTSQLSTQVGEIISLLKSARRPVLWLGHGIRLAGAVDLIEPLLKAVPSPSLVSWAGIDLIDSDHPLVFGRAGIYGQRAANFVLQNSDFVLAIGTRLAIPQIGYDISELARQAKLAVVDVDPAEATKHSSRTAISVTSDARVFMKALIEHSRSAGLPDYSSWAVQCKTYKERFPVVGPEHADRDGYINSYPFMERLARHFKSDQIVVTDMGTALLSGHQVLPMRKGQRLMTSTGLGEMGYGLPAAMGASFGRRSEGKSGEVLCLNCDGGMMMNLQELQTIAHHRLPIKTVIFNNDGYLMIKHTQKALYQGRSSGVNRSSGVSCPDFTKLGRAFDFATYQIRSWQDFDAVIPKMQAEAGPTFVEVFTHPEQPLVPKLGLARQPDGSIISPPLEDLSPFLPRSVMRENMLAGIHPKSEAISD